MAWDPEDPPRISSLHLYEEGPFRYPNSTFFKVEFDPEVNVFIGPNATGKSTILYALEQCSSSQCILYWSGDLLVQGEETNYAAVPVVYLPPIREVLPRFDEDNIDRWSYTSFSREPRPFPHVENCSVKEEIGEAQKDWRTLLDDIDGTDYRGIFEVLGHAHDLTSFDSAQVYHALQELRADDLSGDGGELRAATVVSVAYTCVRDICPEVLQSDPANFIHYRQKYDGPLAFASTGKEYFAMGAKIAGGNEALYWGDLSTGTQGLFGWVCYLALKMACHYSFSDGADADGRSYRWQDQAAILLIDEIENHLHPTWQRRVIPALRKHFPGLQIFATTHSPFVVAGLKRGQVHRLYREKGVIKTDKLTEEEKEHKLVGWTVEEILREFMDVTDPTDEATATAAATLRWLRGRYPSNGEVTAVQWVQECIQQLQDNPERTRDEEYAWHWLKAKQSGIAADDATPGLEWRDAALDELRDIVSPDLEAGGPLAAQQELFITQLRDLLADDEIDSHDPDEEV